MNDCVCAYMCVYMCYGPSARGPYGGFQSLGWSLYTINTSSVLSHTFSQLAAELQTEGGCAQAVFERTCSHFHSIVLYYHVIYYWTVLERDIVILLCSSILPPLPAPPLA